VTKVQAEAIVLDKVAYSEKDLVVTFLTSEHGVIPAIARGARGSKRRFSWLDLFVKLSVIFVPKTPPKLWVVQEASVAEVYSDIFENLERLEAGQAIVALLKDALKDAPVMAELYQKVVGVLKGLSSAPAERAYMAVLDTLRIILDALGHGSVCEHCQRDIVVLNLGAFLLPSFNFICSECGTKGDGVFMEPAQMKALFLQEDIGKQATLALVSKVWHLFSQKTPLL